MKNYKQSFNFLLICVLLFVFVKKVPDKTTVNTNKDSITVIMNMPILIHDTIKIK